VIVEGEVEITRRGAHESEQGPGAYVGEIALLRDVPRTTTVTRKTPLRLLALEREPFLLAVTSHLQSHEAAREVTSARMA
jgi:CRP-like cAMP-binding protein